MDYVRGRPGIDGSPKRGVLYAVRGWHSSLSLDFGRRLYRDEYTSLVSWYPTPSLGFLCHLVISLSAIYPLRLPQY